MAQLTDSASQLFGPVRVARASEEIVAQIKTYIFESRLAPGNRLPSEKELSVQFGLSRTTVRDALRILESQGLITIKVGAGGGTFVADPSARPVTEIMTAMLRLKGMTPLELVEARVVVETSIVRFAAERATPADLAAMQAAIDQAVAGRAAGDPHFTPYSVGFHTALAKAAKNEVLLFTVDSLRTIFHETLDRLLPNDEMAQRAIEDHQEILNAIARREADRACEIMSTHLMYFEQRVHDLGSIRI